MAEEFYDKLIESTPQWMKDEQKARATSLHAAIFMPDSTRIVAEAFALKFKDHMPTEMYELRDLLYVYARCSERELKRMCNSYAKQANDALRIKPAESFYVPFPGVESTQ